MSEPAPAAAVTSPPDDPDLADAAADWRCAYVHLPFCRRRCPYCDFAVVARDEGPADRIRYADAVVAEVAMEEPWGPLHAVSLGGGTPTQTPPGDLRRIVDALTSRFALQADAEVSIEANPEDWSDDLAAELVAIGFNRLSLGGQSFDRTVLSALGRLHEPSDVGIAVASARRAGFTSINIDLIFGTPGESARSWLASVEAALSLDIDHLSAYALTVEPGTELSRRVHAGAASPDPDDQADKYETLLALVADAGLTRYEVSNFARPGHHCRYNLATWAAGEYVAFGLGAHDHRDGVRHRNHRRLDRYVESVAAGQRPRLGSEERDGWGREQDRLMVGLRRGAGVTPGPVGEALLASPEGERMLAAGIIVCDAGRIVVTKPLLTDVVVRSVLSLSPGEC